MNDGSDDEQLPSTTLGTVPEAPRSHRNSLRDSDEWDDELPPRARKSPKRTPRLASIDFDETCGLSPGMFGLQFSPESRGLRPPAFGRPSGICPPLSDFPALHLPPPDREYSEVIMLSDTNLPEAGSSETHRPAAEFALPSEHASESLENEIAHSVDLSPRLANT